MTSPRDKGEAPPASGRDAEQPAVTIGHDGKIDGIYRPRDQRRAFTPTDDAQLELAAQKRPEPAPIVLPERKRAKTSTKAILAAAVIAALLFPLAARWALRAWNDYRAAPAKARGLIVIDSVPSNARVFVDGKEVGRTPWVAPNSFEPGTTVSARVVYPGAQDWNGTFEGGIPATLTAELQASPAQ